MRIEVFGVLACALLCCAAVFLPAAKLVPRERSLVRNDSISLYGLGQSKEEVRGFLTGYRDSRTRRVGAEVLGKVAPHLRGRVRAHADETQEAIAALDSIRDEDIETVGTIAAAAAWALLALNLVVAGLVIGADPAHRRGRGRAIAALVGTLVVVAIGLGIHVVLRLAVDSANAELSYPLFSLRAGAYLIPAAAVGAAVASAALLLAFARRPRTDPAAAA